MDLKKDDAQGYVDAFYQIGQLLDIPAMSETPRHVFENVMLPRLKALISVVKKCKCQALTPEVGDLSAIRQFMRDAKYLECGGYSAEKLTLLMLSELSRLFIESGLLRGDVAGMVMVPIEPSEEQLWHAVNASVPALYKECPSVSLLKEVAGSIYVAMVDPELEDKEAYKAMIKAARE